MKRCLKISLVLTLLVMLTACGKDNKSGKSNGLYPWGTSSILPYTAGMQTPGMGMYAVSQVINENPCIASPMQQRMQVQVPLTNFPTLIPANDVYVGVTSYGDVGAIVGTGAQPTFIAYLCPRSMMTGQGQLRGISLGSYSQCAGFKPISAATMYFPDGTSANFRMMDFGTSTGQRFSMCR